MSKKNNRTLHTIWCGSAFSPSATALLRDGTGGHRLRFAEPGAAPAGLAEAEIALGQPDPDIVMASGRLRWVHLTSAGYTRYDRDDLKAALRARGAQLTNSSHVYDEPCAQHALAMILALARQLPQSHESQRTDRAWRTGERRADSFLLGGGQTVLLLGFGAIARRLVELLAPFGMRVVAVRRSPAQGDERVAIIGEAALDGALAESDHVVNILPDNPSTRGYVSAARLARMKPGARFYNIGRGATVDQEALIASLRSGRLAAAYLDVTDPEPLPADHPLWTAPNCFITPHSAGGHAGEEERLVEHFLRTLAAFERGAPLADRVV
jgi:phosphoglycerate dehydrogenase-like enzyme